MTVSGGSEFDLAELRAEFALDPAVHHVNHGSFGAVPRAGREAQHGWRQRLDRNPVGFFMREAMPEVARARGQIATFLGLREDDLALVRNSTEAASVVLRGLSLEPGDEILVFDQEYGAVTLAAQRVAHLTGAHVVELAIPMTRGDGEILGAVLSAISERTRVLIVDHITSMTARVMPVAELSRLCREQQIQIVVDASHCPGNIDTDFASLDPDFWFGNLHKWACAPIATGVLYIAPRHRTAHPALITSWNDELPYPAQFDMLGTIDYSAWLATPAVLDFIGQIGWQRWRAATVQRAEHGTKLIADALKQNAVQQLQIPMGLVPLGQRGGRPEAFALQSELARQFNVETAITTFDDDLYVRVSGQVYNDAGDYQALVTGLRSLLSR